MFGKIQEKLEHIYVPVRCASESKYCVAHINQFLFWHENITKIKDKDLPKNETKN